MVYVIQDQEGDYFSEDEDSCSGWSYFPQIDKFTVRFTNEKDALQNCGAGDIVVSIEE